MRGTVIIRPTLKREILKRARLETIEQSKSCCANSLRVLCHFSRLNFHGAASFRNDKHWIISFNLIPYRTWHLFLSAELSAPLTMKLRSSRGFQNNNFPIREKNCVSASHFLPSLQLKPPKMNNLKLPSDKEKVWKIHQDSGIINYEIQ